MEFKNLVFEAASNGQLYRLKVFLDHRPIKGIKKLVSAYTNGATPLGQACRNGHIEVVLFLLNRCHADIEQVGSVTFDGDEIEGAPPLWCAAAAGHLDIVKTLIRYNASVNNTTKSNSTPLRAACFDGHFDMVKFLIQNGADIEISNQQGHTCLMIACYRGHYNICKYLLECGANVNRKTAKGNTALHDCAESGSLAILKLILQYGAKYESDFSGTSPLLYAAISGNASIVEYFIEEYNLTKLEKINALELLGATFMDKKRDMINTLNCWRRAMQMRYENSEFPLEKPCTRSPISSYVDATEVHTLQQLEELIFDPDEMGMQALLVRERILGPGHHDTIYYIRHRGARYINTGNSDRCIQLWMYVLDVQQKFQEPLNPIIQSVLFAFAELFAYMISEDWPFAKRCPAVSFKDIFHVFQRALKEIETTIELSRKQNQDLINSSKLHTILIIVMLLIGLMCKLQPHLNKNEILELKRGAYQLVHLNPRARNGLTPLHLACLKDSSSLGQFPVFAFPSPEVVDLLLEVGASPNAVDVRKNTPLHLAAMNRPCPIAVFCSLLKYGAHPDCCNLEKQTPLQLAKHTILLKVYPIRYVSLQCHCARVIRTHKIPYEEFVHKELKEFIDLH